MRTSNQRFIVAIVTAMIITGVMPAIATAQQGLPAALTQQTSASQKSETSGATGIYSDQKVGTTPQPPRPVVQETSKEERTSLKKQDSTVPPPSGPSAKVQSSSSSPRMSGDNAPAGAISLDAIRSSRNNTFDRVSQAVEQSIKVHVNVAAETPTPVRLSNRDINRITCQDGQIKDIVYSKEKGLMVNFTGKDAFLKYRIIKQGSSMKYITGPTELYITCNDHIYTIIAVPEGIPAQIVRLSGGSMEKIKKNASAYGGMALEKKVISLIKAVYTDNIPESFSVSRPLKRVDLFNDIDMTLDKVVSMDGEGVQVFEYKASISKGSKLKKVKLVEKDFLEIGLTKRPVAIAVEKSTLEKDATVRIFVCETTGAAGESKGLPNVMQEKER